MDNYILAIDQGTTGTTTLLIDRHLEIRMKVTVDFPQHYPRPGWVEHDPEEIWFSVCQAIRRVLQQAGVAPRAVVAVGITNQRETTLLWERASGRPAGNAIVWQDRRSADICREFREQGLEPLVRSRTGLLFDPYFAGTKLTWRLREDPALRTRAEKGELAFGTVDSFLVWRLTGGSSHVTDVSNASRTLLMELRTSTGTKISCASSKFPAPCCRRFAPRPKYTAIPEGWRCCPTASRWRGWRGISRRPFSGRPAFLPERANAPTARGRFCWRTPAGRLSRARTSC